MTGVEAGVLNNPLHGSRARRLSEESVAMAETRRRALGDSEQTWMTE